MARRTISKRTEHRLLIRQREAAPLSDGGPITFFEFVPPEDLTPLEMAQSIRMEILAGLKHEADKAEAMADFLRRTVQQFEGEQAPQTSASVISDAVGAHDADNITIQDLKNIFSDYYYKKSDPLRILRLWGDLLRAICLLGDAENIAAGRPTMRDILQKVKENDRSRLSTSQKPDQ